MKKHSFTLIEILIALVVFGIWILSVFVLVTNNIWLVQKVKVKTTATFLAREWLEYAFNQRDTNLFKWVDWRCAKLDQNYNCFSYFGVWNAYRLEKTLTWNYTFITTSVDYKTNLLYFHSGTIVTPNSTFTWFWYDHNNIDWQASVFSRYIYFTWAYLQWDGNVWDESLIMKVQSHVDFNKSNLAKWEVILESFIWQIK